jgi:signal transduction histidine kinase
VSQALLTSLATILCGLALFVWRARPDSAINRWFAIYTTTMAAWVFGNAGLHSGHNLEFWGRFTFAGASTMPAAFLAFTKCYPTRSRWPSQWLLYLTLAIGILFGIVSLATPWVVHNVHLTAAGLTRKTGFLYPVYSIYFLVSWGSALGLFVAKWRRSSGMAQAQLQYLAAGVVIPVAGGIATNLVFPLLTGRSTSSWLGPYFALLLVGIVGHAIIRHRLMDLRIVISRGLAYIVLILVVFVTLLGSARAAGWSAKTLIVQPELTLLALVAFAMLTKPVQFVVNGLIDPYLYRGTSEYESTLRHATHRLSHLMQPKQLADELREILTESLVPEFFAMAARPRENGPFELLADGSSKGPQNLAELVAVAALLFEAPASSALVVAPESTKATHKATHEELRTAGIEIVTTLGRRGRLLGIVLLGPRRSGDAYFARDLTFVESLAEIASIALENALLYRQQIQILEYSDRLLESLNSAVVAVDVGGRITSFNPVSKYLLGLRDFDKGSGLNALPSEVGWALALTLTELWSPKDVEVTIDHITRGLVPAILSTATLHDDRDQTAGALVVITDLSTVKALERQQRRIEHFTMMARFYAGIAHEIRSPLAAISNFVSMLPDRFDDPEYRDTAARLLPGEVARIVGLADRLRLMAPSEDGKLSIVDLSALLTDLVALHGTTAEENGVKIDLELPEAPTSVLGDRAQLIQLFLNLLKNAVEAMPNGGTLTVSCTEFADTVTVQVLDEGVGFPSSLRASLFQPFFTTKPQGTGLGLSICKEIADFHRATLELLPRVDRGGTLARVRFSPSALEAQNDAVNNARAEPLPPRTYSPQIV